MKTEGVSLNLKPVELTRRVQEEFYKMVKGYNGQRFEVEGNTSDGGIGRDIVGSDGELHSPIYNKLRNRFGEAKDAYKRAGMPDGTFFITQLFHRRGSDNLYLASRVSAVDGGKLGFVLQTNDKGYIHLTGLGWKPVDLKAPLGYEEPKPAGTSKPPVREPAKDSKSIEESCKEQQDGFERVIGKLGGERFRSENYSGPLITINNGMWVLTSCRFTEPVGRFVSDLSQCNSDKVREGYFLGAEIHKKPGTRKYMAVTNTLGSLGLTVALETNDFDFIKRSLDRWRRVK